MSWRDERLTAGQLTTLVTSPVELEDAVRAGDLDATERTDFDLHRIVKHAAEAHLDAVSAPAGT